MANVLNSLSFGDSGLIQFMDDGTFVFRPKHGASVAGIELAGFLQLDQQAAPGPAPSGSARLYFDTGQQQILESIAGGAYNVLGVATSISQGGGSVTVNADGSITLTVGAGKNFTANFAAGSNLSTGAAGGITLNGQSSSSISISSAGSIALTPASGQNVAVATSGGGLFTVNGVATSG